MANIKQQKKRIGIAQRQRLENLRVKSTIKTHFRRLQDAVNVGDRDTAQSVHRELVKLIDRSVNRNVLHSNTAARKKARAWRLLQQEPVADTAVVRRSRKKAVKPVAAKTTKAKATKATDEAKPKAKAKPKAAAKPAAAETPEAEAPEAEAPEAAAEAVVEEAPEAAAPAEEAPVAEADDAPEATSDESPAEAADGDDAE
jgi:small subunit ribosomal protein S20